MKKLFYPAIAALAVMASCSQEEMTPVVSVEEKVLDSYTITADNAIDIANEFFKNMPVTRATDGYRVVKSVSEYRHSLTTRSGNDAPDFYVVNYDQENGYALVSADVRRPVSVYAFSESGNLNIADTADNRGLALYLRNISPIPETTNRLGDYGPVQPQPGDWGPVEILKAPMLPQPVRHWDQMTLNKYVKEKTGLDAPVGCVPLAVAQVMCHNSWPNRWPIEDFDEAEERYTFDWDDLRTWKVHDKLARFVEILGRKEYLNTTYSTKSGSSSLSDSIIPTLKKMGYKGGMKVDPFKTDIAINQILNDSVIILSGSGNTCRHCWTADGAAQQHWGLCGFDGKYIYHLYLHFVWGDWGNTDGYYYYDSSSDSFKENAMHIGVEDSGNHPYTDGPHDRVVLYCDFKIDPESIN